MNSAFFINILQESKCWFCIIFVLTALFEKIIYLNLAIFCIISASSYCQLSPAVSTPIGREFSDGRNIKLSGGNIALHYV